MSALLAARARAAHEEGMWLAVAAQPPPPATYLPPWQQGAALRGEREQRGYYKALMISRIAISPPEYNGNMRGYKKDTC